MSARADMSVFSTCIFISPGNRLCSLDQFSNSVWMRGVIPAEEDRFNHGQTNTRFALHNMLSWLHINEYPRFQYT
jgi:hypothetical protein